MISTCLLQFLEPGKRIAVVSSAGAKYGTIMQVVYKWDVHRGEVEVDWDEKGVRTVRWSINNSFLETVCENCGRVRDEHANNLKCLYSPTTYRGIDESD